MRGGEVVRRARERALLSVAELAGRLPEGSEITVEVLRRWEDGSEEPPFEQVEAVVRASGAELATVLAEPDLDPHDAALLETTLALSVTERLERLVAHVRFVEAGRAAMRAAR